MNSVKPGVPVMYDNDGLALQSFYNIFLDAHGNILIISHHVHSVCIGQDLKYLEWCAGLLWIHLCYSVTGDFSYTETLRHKLDVYLNKGVTIYITLTQAATIVIGLLNAPVHLWWLFHCSFQIYQWENNHHHLIIRTQTPWRRLFKLLQWRCKKK